MRSPSDAGLQPFLFGLRSRANDKREQKEKENNTQPLKSERGRKKMYRRRIRTHPPREDVSVHPALL